jgi:broad specificity phosphatase PhoE
VLRTLPALVALAASAALAGCGSSTGTGPPSDGATAGGITVVAPSTQPAVAHDVVMIIRHGEKPDGSAPGLDAAGEEDDSSLTALGWERAHALVGLFDPAEGDPRPGLTRPATIYAAGVTDEGEGQRTRETVAPLAEALGVPVDTEFGKGDEKKLVKKVLEQSGPALISWQHGEIPAIVDEFPDVSPEPPQEWPSDRFDVVWTLTRTADGWQFAQAPELVLPQDQSDVIEE